MFESKLPNVTTTIFSVMTALAQKAGAVNVSQGFPDYPIDPLLSELLAKASLGGYNQYAPMPGVGVLRERVSQKYKLVHDIVVDADTEVTITPGGTSAIFCALAAIVRPGDEVIVLEPCYDSLWSICRCARWGRSPCGSACAGIHTGLGRYSRCRHRAYTVYHHQHSA